MSSGSGRRLPAPRILLALLRSPRRALTRLHPTLAAGDAATDATRGWSELLGNEWPLTIPGRLAEGCKSLHSGEAHVHVHDAERGIECSCANRDAFFGVPGTRPEKLRRACTTTGTVPAWSSLLGWLWSPFLGSVWPNFRASLWPSTPSSATRASGPRGRSASCASSWALRSARQHRTWDRRGPSARTRAPPNIDRVRPGCCSVPRTCRKRGRRQAWNSRHARTCQAPRREPSSDRATFVAGH
jgi:hypothetical protein